MRPMIWQERLPYEFQQMTETNNPHVFMQDEYVYGVRARVNAGFGLWQLAWGSKQPLNPANYAIARAAMQNMKGDGGRILGVMPNVLVVPPSLETDARTLLKAATSATGASNPWFESADLIVTPYIA